MRIPAYAKGASGVLARWMKVGFSLNTNSGEYGASKATAEENRCFLMELLDQATEADRLGYNGVFVAERHSRPECRVPTPLQLLTLVAERTRQCELVTHVLLLPLHHPCDVAEQAVVADIVSGGRLVLGVGMGFDERYFRTFGVDMAERLERFLESLQILRLAWSGTLFDFRGNHFQIDQGCVLPRPVREGGPPLWIGGEVRATVERAARYGDAWVVAWPMAPNRWRELTEHYRRECSAAGKVPFIVYSKHCWFAESRAEAERWFVPMWLEEMRYYWKLGRLRHPDFASLADFNVATARRHLIYGNAEDCLEALSETKALGVDYVKISMRLPLGPPIDIVNESMRAFAVEVLPRLEIPDEEDKE